MQPQMPRTTTTSYGLTVGARDAKTHFGQLLDRVEHGEVFVITRHGEPSPDSSHSQSRSMRRRSAPPSSGSWHSRRPRL